MFLDGVTYAALARNFAEGRGRFWFPFYTATVYPTFHEQPPLGLTSQAAAFFLFGDHLFVERAYSVAIGALTGLVMILIWRRVHHDTSYDWLPVIFWLLPPAVTWSIVNNMLEVSETLFTSGAILAFLHSLGSKRWWIWAAAAGAAVGAAVLTKGPTGLFPLAAPAVGAILLPGRAREALRSGALMFSTLVAIALILLMTPAATTSLSIYWEQQVVASLQGTRGGANRWSSMTEHFGAPIVTRMAILALMIWAAARFGRGSRTRPDSSASSWTSFFLLLGFAGSLPIAVSPRIAGHYFLPAAPLFALAFSSVSLTSVRSLNLAISPRARPIAGALGAIFLVATFAIPALGRSLEPRDVSWMPEYEALEPFMAIGATVGTCPAVATDWGIHAYMQRFFEVSLDTDNGLTRPHYLQLKDRTCAEPPGCSRVVQTPRFALFECAAK